MQSSDCSYGGNIEFHKCPVFYCSRGQQARGRAAGSLKEKYNSFFKGVMLRKDTHAVVVYKVHTQICANQVAKQVYDAVLGYIHSSQGGGAVTRGLWLDIPTCS